jgi:hypothetical protein
MKELTTSSLQYYVSRIDGCAAMLKDMTNIETQKDMKELALQLSDIILHASELQFLVLNEVTEPKFTVPKDSKD